MVMKMYKISEDNASVIRERMKRIKSANAYKRLQAVALRGEGKSNEEIAGITNFNAEYVGCLCKKYCTKGLDALIEDGRKGGNNRLMNEVEAAEFLEQFEEQARGGEIITAEAIGAAYDKATGKERKSLSSVYYFLQGHGWRKIMPKKQHPGKASDEAIEASKKLTLS
jgi:transposase